MASFSIVSSMSNYVLEHGNADQFDAKIAHPRSLARAFAVRTHEGWK